MLKKFIKNRYFPFLVLLVLIIPTFIFLLKPGIYWNMHDDMQMIRQLEMEKCLKDGQIPCRWTSDFGYGYGLPLFNYYPPLPYIVGQIFRITGLTFVATVRYIAVLQIVLSAIFMYLLASSIFGPLGGLISGLFYSYAPYHAVNIYVRGAMNEAWSAVFFPLIFLFSKKLIETQKIRYVIALSISFAMLLLSHNPMVLIFSPFLVIWSFYWIYTLKLKKVSASFPILLKLFLSALLSLGLSAFFTIPAIFESNLVQMDKMFTGYYSYFNHFASLFQLFISNFWGDGSSVWGPNDGLSFSVGYLHWIIPTLMLLILGIKYLKRHRLSILEISVVGLILMAYLSAFMSHERSTFIWKLFPLLQKIQFPWRFLNLTEFLFSLSAGFLPFLIIRKKSLKLKNYVLFTALISLLIVINIKHFTPITYGPITDQQKFSGVAWTNQISGGVYDYLPISAHTAPSIEAKAYIDQINPADTVYNLTSGKKGTDWQLFNIKLNKPALIFLPILDFPNFDINLDGRLVKHQIDPELGRISISLDAGQHQVYVKLRNTPIRTISNIITLISLISLIPLIFISRWKKST